MTTDFKQAHDLIVAAQDIAVVSHIRPDGDAVGSILALAESLQAAGKDAVPVLIDGLPDQYAFLPGAEHVRTELPREAELVICVDCSDRERTGLPADVFDQKPSINIDHHPTNTGFAAVNHVQPKAAASVEIVYELMGDLHLPLNEAVRTNLLAGLLTDTIGFRTSNVHPGTLRMAADLLDQGTDLPGLYERVLNERSFISAKYWGYGLQKIQMKGQVVWTSLSLADRNASGYPGTDDADLINFMSTITGGKVTILFIEQAGGSVKVSWRARDGVDVAELARRFGGGGHKPAAGAMISGELKDIEEKVLNLTTAYLETIRD